MADIFINHLIGLVIKERDEEERLTNKLLDGSPGELQEKGVAILNLRVEGEISMDDRVNKMAIILVPAYPESYPPVIPRHKLTVGDMVEFKEDFSRDSMSEISGIVSKTDRRFIQVDVQGRSHYGKPIEIDFPDSMMQLCHIMLEALTELRNGYLCGSPLYNVLLGRSKPSQYDPESSYGMDFFDRTLNASQREAVQFCIGSEEVALIHGPPGTIDTFNILSNSFQLINNIFLLGTGKTHTLIEIIRQLVENQCMKVLVCGPSNVAVDNLLERVMKYETINTVRVGNIARVSPLVIERTLELLAFGADDPIRIGNIVRKQVNELNERLKSLVYTQGKEIAATENAIQRLFRRTSSLEARNCTNDVMSDADVVFCTLNAAGSVPMLLRKFDVVIVDEAAQATEPDCWIAAKKGRKLILAGDHLQLPPTVKSLSGANGPKVKGMSTYSDLSYTLFDRLLDMYGDRIKVMLSVQYRMHEKIMRFSSQELYESQLDAHCSVASHLLSDLKNTRNSSDTSQPVVFIDTSDLVKYYEIKDSKGEERSTANELEVLIVAAHIRKLINYGGLQQDQIGIITPYAAQVAKLNDELGEAYKGIDINSVDGFQGREKEAIIISMVRSNKRGEVGFLAEKRRLNVAMTRAKRHLVVIGDIRTLSGRGVKSTSPIDRQFLTKWIEWLDGESDKRRIVDYLRI
ncbi:hypothetical protein INT47_003278 [Mucor saturninus]|uniref:DNA helicase n=1 Tax=Mucor saturninus TaxID=64648 RepID=A0A8H7VBC9_9FUNG|nr:hypothetical protein INT47_003278 [Mucor saturninus]